MRARLCNFVYKLGNCWLNWFLLDVVAVFLQLRWFELRQLMTRQEYKLCYLYRGYLFYLVFDPPHAPPALWNSTYIICVRCMRCSPSLVQASLKNKNILFQYASLDYAALNCKTWMESLTLYHKPLISTPELPENSFLALKTKLESLQKVVRGVG